jgi:cyclopropane fatty-acyl-phospholipid synthase-like methyltransferase
MKMYTRTDLIPKGGFDKITSLEMAEHVGIRRYQEFLTSVPVPLPLPTRVPATTA